LPLRAKSIEWDVLIFYYLIKCILYGCEIVVRGGINEKFMSSKWGGGPLGIMKPSVNVIAFIAH